MFVMCLEHRFAGNLNTTHGELTMTQEANGPVHHPYFFTCCLFDQKQYY